MSHHIGLLFRVDNVGEVRNWRLAVSPISGWHILILLAVLTASGIYCLLSLFFDRHFWGPLLAQLLGFLIYHHFWGQLLTVTLGSFYDHHFLGPLLAATFGVLF